MFLVLSLIKTVHDADLSSEAKEKVVRRFYCKAKFEAILREMGEALEEFENYKSQSDESYFCKTKEYDDSVHRVKIITTEIDILDYKDQYKNFLKEAKIAETRKCLCS